LTELDNLINSQQQKIENLQANLERQITLNNQLRITPSEVEEVKGLESLTMEDFEKKMKNQFFDRFKGYAIEITGKRLESMQKEFDRDSGKLEWSSQYENHISNYIQDNDPERLHFVDELNCNSNMCRLKVSSSEPNGWNRLFLNLTQQTWYNSITLKENSEDPTTFIYFITKPKSES
jgi:regulator of replication initiation timing